MRASHVVQVPLLAICIAGCAGKTPAPETPNQVVAEGQNVTPSSSAPPPAAAPAPAAPPSASSTMPFATSSGQAQPLAPAAAASATPVLASIGQAEAPGAQPQGGPFAGNFQEGQTLTQPFNIEPGKCYTVVAAGVGVAQMDVQIVVQPAPMLPPTVLAQSTGSSPTAVVGGKATGCLRNPYSIGGPAQVVVRATRGAGMIAAQIYVK